MPLDFRLHVFTLVAVFLALGIGIIIGVMMPQDRMLVEQQREIIQRLEEDFHKLRADNRRLAQDNAQLRQEQLRQAVLLDTLTKQAVAHRLQGQTVLLYELGQVTPELRGQIQSIIETAGAEILKEGLNVISPADWAESLPEAILFVYDRVDSMLNTMALDDWRKLIRRYQELGIPVAVVGSDLDNDEIGIDLWKELGISHVFDASTPTAQVDLIMALSGSEASP